MAWLDLTTLSCCGIKEIHGIGDCSTPEEALKTFMVQHSPSNKWRSDSTEACLYIFSGVVRERGTKNNYDQDAGLVTDTTYGPKLAAYIRKHKLGQVTSGPKRVNLNHKLHTIQAWFWAPNWEALKKWNKEAKSEGVSRGNA